MKLHILNILAAIAALLGLSACADEPLGGSATLPPGVEVELELALSVPEPMKADAVVSRALVNDELNRQVNDLCLFIFDENDRLINRYYFPSVSAETATKCDPAYSTGTSAAVIRTAIGRGTITGIHTTTGRRRIVAAANVNYKGNSIILGDLAEVETFNDFKTVIAREDNVNANVFIMSGAYVATDGSSTDGSVNINSRTLDGKLNITMIESSVKFIIDGNGLQPEDSDIPAGKFTLKSWRVYNLPGRASLWPAEGTTSAPKFNSGVMDQFSANVNGDANTYGFMFFALENKPEARQGADIRTYADRAAWQADEGTLNTAPENKKWTNAPEGATYVVLRGTYSGASKVNVDGNESVKNVHAEVSYTVFLGHNSATDFTDFNTLRNVEYTYKVHVTGVNSIIVEVVAKEDQRPDGEGHVTIGNQSRVTLDAHFCQHTLKITAATLRSALNLGTFGCQVSVPPLGVNGNYTYNPGGENDFEGLEWVEAYVHKASDPDYMSYTAARGSASAKATLSVGQLFERLHQFAESDAADDDEITVTLYFGEYLYPESAHPWTSVVNSDERIFSMLGSAMMSPDGNSSLTTDAITFSQLPIRTIYNYTSGRISRAWGVEAIEEPIRANGATTMRYNANFNTGGLVPGGNSKYGRQNNWRQLYKDVPARGDRRYDYFLDADGMVKEGTKFEMVAACLTRNRDLNGNGRIDADEFLWYVPSIEQLQQLYICNKALPADMRLYNPEEEMRNFTGNTWKFKHYVSSSGKILWAEEGGSTGAFNNWRDQSDYFIRCVRDLGTDASNSNENVPYNIATQPEAQFQDLFEVFPPDAGRDKEHVAGRLSLDRLTSSALRLTMERVDVGGVVNTFSNSNAPARMFEWADTLINKRPGNVSVLTDNAKAAAVPQGITECRRVLGPGWRLPTLSELVALWWHLGDAGLAKGIAGSSLVTRTTYYFGEGYSSPTGGYRRSHVFDVSYANAPLFSLTNAAGVGKESGHMLCVRDYIP